jgi:sulfate adenylyltransferase subunit 1 (EFTu-like GTPase family)
MRFGTEAILATLVAERRTPTIILLDARRGLLRQTPRHAVIAHFVDVRYCVLAVNKLNLAPWDCGAFCGVIDAFRDFTRWLNFASMTTIILSARNGDNGACSKADGPWYSGPKLLRHFYTIEIEGDLATTKLAPRPSRSAQLCYRSHRARAKGLDFDGAGQEITNPRV